MPDDTTLELWDAQQVADFLGVQPGSVRRQLSRWGIERAGTGTSAAGRITALYRADQVRAAHAARPGRGAGGGRRKAS
ncbi:hypothetical protein [Streptomyces sp. DH20]|uniref:hypothetical protein n=1 Tax=Streptomyces sp. DH20 TaxID=2857009 RepID=UPI001E5814B3|nr:hypothetical protein [Streptomyces sp. DH20]